MYETSDIRKGLKIQIDGQPYVVVDFQFVKPGKGTPFTRTKVKNLISGSVLEKTYKTGERLEPANVEERKMQYLYREGDNFCFMDQETFDQIHIPIETVTEQSAGFMPEQCEVLVMVYNDRPVGVTLPNFVVVQITRCDPGVRGDTATGASKPATLSTGATIQVPLFVNEGEHIRVDTRTGEYMERA